VAGVEDAGLVVDVIAAFGDGQADDASCWISQHLQYVLRIVGCERVPAQRADDSRSITLRAALDDRVQIILWDQRFGHTPITRQ